MAIEDFTTYTEVSPDEEIITQAEKIPYIEDVYLYREGTRGYIMSGPFKESELHHAMREVSISVHYKALSKYTSKSDNEFSIKFDLPLTEGQKSYIQALIKKEGQSDEETEI